MNLKKNLLLIGYQKGAITNLKFCFKEIFKKKVKKLNLNYFNKSEIEKKILNINSSRFKILEKYRNNYQIIIGSSEKKIEVNFANYCINNQIDFFFYIDSITNIKKRFEGLFSIPKKIICINETISDEIKCTIKKTSYYSKIIDLKMPYQNYLKKKYSKIIRKNKCVIYLSSFLGVNVEKKYISKLINANYKKSIYICLHPRDNLSEWKKKYTNQKNIKIFFNRNFYANKNISAVYGVSTMGLINYKFAGFKVYYFQNKKLSRDPFVKLLKIYKIKKLIYIPNVNKLTTFLEI